MLLLYEVCFSALVEQYVLLIQHTPLRKPWLVCDATRHNACLGNRFYMFLGKLDTEGWLALCKWGPRLPLGRLYSRRNPGHWTASLSPGAYTKNASLRASLSVQPSSQPHSQKAACRRERAPDTPPIFPSPLYSLIFYVCVCVCKGKGWW